MHEQPSLEKGGSIRLRGTDCQSPQGEGYWSVTRWDSPCATLTKASMSDKRRCQKFDLPKCNQVTILVDAETKSKPTIEREGAGGGLNLELGTIYLDRLGIIPKLFRSFGQLSTLYVMERTPRSETSSQIISD